MNAIDWVNATDWEDLKHRIEALEATVGRLQIAENPKPPEPKVGLFFRRIFPTKIGLWHQIGRTQWSERWNLWFVNCDCGTGMRPKWAYVTSEAAPPIETLCRNGRATYPTIENDPPVSPLPIR